MPHLICSSRCLLSWIYSQTCWLSDLVILSGADEIKGQTLVQSWYLEFLMQSELLIQVSWCEHSMLMEMTVWTLSPTFHLKPPSTVHVWCLVPPSPTWSTTETTMTTYHGCKARNPFLSRLRAPTWLRLSSWQSWYVISGSGSSSLDQARISLRCNKENYVKYMP